MKAQRLLLAISVIGAVIVGGAVTGTTLASWQDQAELTGSSVESGSMRLQVNGASSVDLSGISALKPGVPETRVLTFTNDGEGRNLRMVVRASTVTHTPIPMPLDLRFRPRNGSPDDCAGGSFMPMTNGAQLTEPLDPGASGQVCLSVSVSQVPYDPARSTVSLSFVGTQVRP